MREAGRQVALVLASQWLEDDTGADLLAYVKHVHPRAKRGLMIDWGAWGDRRTRRDPRGDRPRPHRLLRAEAVGPPDEYFHRTITEFLHEWSRADAYGTYEVDRCGGRLVAEAAASSAAC